MKAVIFGNPIGKPRMTKADRWRKRPCVLRYFAWANQARVDVLKGVNKLTLKKPTVLIVKAYFDSGTQHRVGPHTVKPDGSNVLKACEDALFENDQMLYKTSCEKYWCDGGQPRCEIEWHS